MPPRPQPPQQKRTAINTLYTSVTPKSRSGITSSGGGNPRGGGSAHSDQRLPIIAPASKGIVVTSGVASLEADAALDATIDNSGNIPYENRSNVFSVSDEAAGTVLSVGGGVNSTLLSTVGSDSLAVVPFTPSNGATNGGGSASPSITTTLDHPPMQLSTRRVCPACLRPLNEDDEEDQDEELGTRRRRSRHASRVSGGDNQLRMRSLRPPPHLTPQYFRALALAAHAPQLLQIEDGSDSVNRGRGAGGNLPVVPAPSPSLRSPRLDMSPQNSGEYHCSRSRSCGRSHQRKASKTYGVADVSGEDNSDSYEGGSGNPPLWYYVSPTGPDSYGSAFPSIEDGQKPEGNSPSADPLLRSQEHELSKVLEEEEEQQYQQNEGAGRANTGSSVTGYYKTYFVELQKLGSGTFGGVYLCKHVMEGVPLGIFALKKIPVGDNTAYLQKVLREVRILEEVKRHPNVVEYNHSWVEEAQLADFGPPVRCLFILMEYASEGSLDSYLDRNGTSLSTVAVWYFFLSAVAGTAHLHRKNILHRDLKPQNLLLSGPVGKPPRVLVSDFGTAALLDDISYDRTGGTGTIEYMAPELLECDPNITEERYVNRHTRASDVWSLGMILHFLACDATLPARLPDGSVLLNIESRSPFPRPPEMIELTRAMLQRDPKRRPSCNDILKSTVVQTILRSFNMANLTSGDILPQMSEQSSPKPEGDVICAPVLQERVVEEHEEEQQSDKGGSRAAARITGGGTDAGSPLGPLRRRSSRVELLSSTVLEAPLMMQYHSNEARGNAANLHSGNNTSFGPTGGSGVAGGGGREVSALESQQLAVSALLHSTSQMLKRNRSGSSLDATLRSPLRKKVAMVDAQMQTEPITIVASDGTHSTI